ncbi:MAG: hypothetical protein U0800_18500 [Isosphaeraceae bacterium]
MAGTTPSIGYLYVDDNRLSVGWPGHGYPVTMDPDWTAVSDAIGMLDGDHVTLVILAEGAPLAGTDLPFSGKALAIGGDSITGFYTCKFFDDSEDDLQVFRRDVDSDEYVDIVFGQRDGFHVGCCLARDEVVAVAKLFFEELRLSGDFDWVS